MTRTGRLRVILISAAAAGALALSACASSSPAASGSSTTPTSGGSAPASPSGGSMSSASGATSGGAMTSGGATSGAMTSGGATSGGSSGAAPTSGGAAGAPTALTPADIAAAKATLISSSNLTVCTSLPYVPFEVDDGTGSGKVVGFDLDFMDWVAKDLGVTEKTVALLFPGIQSGQAMKSKKCDVAAAAMTITPERAKNITFSSPYYDASQALMVPASSDIKGLADLKGKKLGAQTGTTGLMYAQKYASQYGYTVTQYQQINDEELALKTGKIDAAIHDQPALNAYVKANTSVAKVVTSFNTGEQYGFGMALGNTALTKVVDYAIAQSLVDGSYKASYEKWIGGTAPTKI